MLELLVLSLMGLGIGSVLVDVFNDEDESDSLDDTIADTDDTDIDADTDNGDNGDTDAVTPDEEDVTPDVEDVTPDLGFGMQLDSDTTLVSLDAESIAALAASSTEALTYYDSRSVTFELEAGAAGDGFLHLVSDEVTFTEEAADGTLTETTHILSILVLSDSAEVPDASQVSFDENGQLVTDGVDAIAAAYGGFYAFVDGEFDDFDTRYPWVTAEDGALTSFYGDSGQFADIAGDDIGLPISEDGTTATIALTAEDLSRYSTTGVPTVVDWMEESYGLPTYNIDDSADLDDDLSSDIESVIIDIPEGFDVAEVKVSHGEGEGLGYAVDRTYYVLIEEGSTLEADDIDVFNLITNGRYGDIGADLISIDGDYGFILGFTTGTTSWSYSEPGAYVQTSTDLDVSLTGNVTAPSQVIDLTYTPPV